MKQSKNKGFTLVELLVAVVLMLILVGAVVTIFTRSAEIFAVSEAKMDLFQNARAAFDQISREIASVQVSNNGALAIEVGIDDIFTINPTNTTTTDQVLMSFFSITSVRNETGRFFVEYVLERAANNRWNLLRRVTTPGADNTFGNGDDQVFSGVLAQFIEDVNDKGTINPGETVDNIPNIRIETVTFAGGNWVYTPVNATVQVVDFNLLPPAIRITIELTDRQRRELRTLSRVFSIMTAQPN